MMRDAAGNLSSTAASSERGVTDVPARDGCVLSVGAQHLLEVCGWLVRAAAGQRAELVAGEPAGFGVQYFDVLGWAKEPACRVWAATWPGPQRSLLYKVASFRHRSRLSE